MYRFTTLICFAAFCLIALETQARTLEVPRDYELIQSAIDEARTGDTVLVNPNLYDENLVIRDKEIVLTSLIMVTEDPEFIESTIINGGARSCAIQLRDGSGATKVRGFTIENGRQSWGGGIDIQSEGSPVLEDLVVMDNVATEGGGGVYASYGATPSLYRCRITGNRANRGAGFAISSNELSATLTDCEIQGNIAAGSGGGIYNYGSRLILRRTSIADNEANEGGAYYSSRGAPNDPALECIQVTISGNVAQRYGALNIMNSDRVSFANCIFWGNEPEQNNINMSDSLIFNHCIVNGDRENFSGRRPTLIECTNQDPGFVDSEAGDYRITRDSPAFDAGDPAFGEDPDGTDPEMGAYSLVQRSAVITGSVIAARNGEPVQFARVTLLNELGEFLTDVTDREGRWGGLTPIRADNLDVTVRVALNEFNPVEMRIEVEVDDSVDQEIRLLQGVVNLSADVISLTVNGDVATASALLLMNDGDGVVHWRAEARGLGPLGIVPGSITDSRLIEDVRQDDWLKGICFDGENYFLAGGNAQDENRIYVLDRDYHLVRHFAQPTHGPRGMIDLAWDGEWIWGGERDTLYAVDREGGVHRRIPLEMFYPHDVAFDPAERVLWVASPTSDEIIALDLNGNNLGRSVDCELGPKVGLAWDKDVEDGFNLLVLLQPLTVVQVNPATGESRRIFQHEDLEVLATSGAAMAEDDARLGTASLLTIISLPEGDKVVHTYLRNNEEWLTLSEYAGVIEAGSEAQLNVLLRSFDEEGSWAFPVGVYEGEIVLSHDGRGSGAIVPVSLDVHREVGVESDATLSPVEFGISAIWPQPFNSELRIEYGLSSSGAIKIVLTDLTGREVRVVEEGFRSAGVHQSSLAGIGLPSGIYLARLEAAGTVSSTKVVCLK